jgi:probable rRNA maturation factor
MAARNKASSTVLAFDVNITADERAPKLKPSQLQALFENAWKRVPSKRRPETEGLRRLAVDIHLINDAQISKFNRAHMKHEGPTDVLSFTMGEFDPERRAFNLGEIVVSFETAEREAKARKLSVTEELSRYCVHGFLHLLGYEDDTETQRTAMFAIQEKVLKSAF